MQLTEQQKQTFKQAIEKFGNTKQIIKAIEEFSEMQKELCKFLLYSDDVDYYKIADEMADVIIMNYQLKKIFDKLNPDFRELVVEQIYSKTLRLNNLLCS